MKKILITGFGVLALAWLSVPCHAQSEAQLPSIQFDAGCLDDGIEDSCRALIRERYGQAVNNAEAFCVMKLLEASYLPDDIDFEQPCLQLSVDKVQNASRFTKETAQDAVNDLVDFWNKSSEVRRRKAQ